MCPLGGDSSKTICALQLSGCRGWDAPGNAQSAQVGKQVGLGKGSLFSPWRVCPYIITVVSACHAPRHWDVGQSLLSFQLQCSSTRPLTYPANPV